MMKKQDICSPTRLTRTCGIAVMLGLTMLVGTASSQEIPPAGAAPGFLAGPELSPPRPVADVPLPSATVTTFADGWTMQITPAQGPAPTYQGRTYDQIYESIPYRKSEHLANPSYRHDSTMEIMFGQLRPTVIHREQSSGMQPSAPQLPIAPMYPWRPYNLGSGSLWNYSTPVLRHIFPFFPYPMLP